MAIFVAVLTGKGHRKHYLDLGGACTGDTHVKTHCILPFKFVPLLYVCNTSTYTVTPSFPPIKLFGTAYSMH